MISTWKVCAMVARRLGRNYKVLLALCVLTLLIFFMKFKMSSTMNRYPIDNDNKLSKISKKKTEVNIKPETSQQVKHKAIFHRAEKLIDQTQVAIKSVDIVTASIKLEKKEFDLCYSLHIFYYPWYSNPKHDGKYLHWNHKYLPHWNEKIAKNYPSGSHVPPADIGSNFYPALGAYSSRDPAVIQDHMEQLSLAGIGVIVVSYYPPGTSDDNGEDWEHLFPDLFNAAEKYGIKVTFQIEPYKGRSELTLPDDIRNIVDKYTQFSSLYKLNHKGKNLPLIYVYDSYHTKSDDWAKILKSGPSSIRGGLYDAFVIGLVVQPKDRFEMVYAGFDGFYTYFASDGFTYGSTRKNWHQLSKFADVNELLFIPSIGPGYIDTRVRPWNGENTKNRLNGRYYSESWNTALEQNTKIISITSFNEWHEGTQIEKSIPKKIDGFEYSNYEPFKPEYYLQMTRSFMKKFSSCKEINHFL